MLLSLPGGSMESVRTLDDAELMSRLGSLVAEECALTARLLVHLGEVDARGLYREQAFASMFEYAIEALHMSENEAYLRIRAARLGRQFPRILAMLEANELHLTAIKLLGPHLTEANHAEVLDRARGKSRSEVEALVAELAPKPDVPSVVRKLAAARATPNDFSSETPRPRATALSPGRYKVQFTASEAMHA